MPNPELPPRANANNEIQPLLGAIGVTVFYPITVARTLAQVGYEPVAPVPGISFWTRKKGMYYPNMISYANHLRQTEGISVLFTGLTSRIMSAMLANHVEKSLDAKLRETFPDKSGDADKPTSKKGVLSTGYEIAVACASKSVSVVVTQPLQVVMVRMICSIASKDEVYTGLYSTIKEIYQTEGIRGFFSGLTPRLLAEIGALALSGVVMYALNRAVEAVGLDDETLKNSPNYTPLVQLYVYGLAYPFQLASTMTTASCRGLRLGIPSYPSWYDHYKVLTEMKQQYRGQSMFYRLA